MLNAPFEAFTRGIMVAFKVPSISESCNKILPEKLLSSSTFMNSFTTIGGILLITVMNIVSF